MVGGMKASDRSAFVLTICYQVIGTGVQQETRDGAVFKLDPCHGELSLNVEVTP